MPEFLFTYGTLRPGHAPPEIAPVVDTLITIGPATIRGRLYDLGVYPGVVLDPDSPTPVPGILYQLPDTLEALTRLDAYEDFRPADPANSLFLRETTLATLRTGDTVLCWVYTWNQQTP